MMPFITKVIKKPVKLEKIKVLAGQQFGDFIKAVVDIENIIIAIG
jgi:hypothetical protein